MYSTAYHVEGRLERHALPSAPTSTRWCWRRAPNSTQAKRKAMYHDMAVIVRDEGGVILPMFNHFIDATGAKVGGWL